MTRDPRLVYASSYLSKLLEFMGMYGWVVRISDEQADFNDWAHIDFEEYNEAVIKLGTRFWAAPPLTKTQVLLHELNHGPIVRIHDSITDAMQSLTKWIPKVDRVKAIEQMEIHRKAAERREEEWVNHIAYLLAPLAPPWDDTLDLGHVTGTAQRDLP